MPAMPKPIALGQHMASTVGTPIFHWQKDSPQPNPHGYRSVMGYFLPPWQRGIVWEQAQCVKLIESLWMGLSIGTYTINRTQKYGHRLDNLLRDGQQRMHALRRYLSDEFEVFDTLWSELEPPDRRRMEMTVHFHCYITDSTDEAYLRSYYNLMNFGGVAHKPGEEA